MLSVGCAAFKPFDSQPVSEFSCNFELLAGAEEDPKTMQWWGKHAYEYEVTRQNVKSPTFVMYHFNEWVKQISNRFNAKPVAVAYPAGFDFTFLYWYLQKFGSFSPFSFACLDMKTLAFATGLFDGYRDTKKRNFPKNWFPKTKHTHIAIDDAIEQGQLFVNMMKHLFRKDPGAGMEKAADIVETLMNSSSYKEG